jgi:hypothetical protein
VGCPHAEALVRFTARDKSFRQRLQVANSLLQRAPGKRLRYCILAGFRKLGKGRECPLDGAIELA